MQWAPTGTQRTIQILIAGETPTLLRQPPLPLLLGGVFTTGGVVPANRQLWDKEFTAPPPAQTLLSAGVKPHFPLSCNQERKLQLRGGHMMSNRPIQSLMPVPVGHPGAILDCNWRSSKAILGDWHTRHGQQAGLASKMKDHNCFANY